MGNQSIPPAEAAASTAPAIDGTVLRAFYANSDRLVHDHLAGALEPDLRQALAGVLMDEDEGWTW